MPGRADDNSAAVAFMREVGHEMPGVLANARTMGERRARLRPFIMKVVDVDAVAQFCLGRYWSRATPAQQRAFQTLFQTVLVNEIALWTSGHDDSALQTSVVMQPAVTEARETYVPTIVTIGGAPPAHIRWVINMQSKPPKILDVTAEGLSLRETLRSDYGSFLNRHNGDIDGLMDVLRQRAAQTGAAGGDPATPHRQGAAPQP